MKKLFFAFCMIILCSSQVAMAQSKTKPTETKDSMLKSLRGIVAKGMIEDGTSKEKSGKFADCFTKELGEKLSLEELKIFYKMNSLKPGQAPSKELVKQAEKMGMKEKMENMGKDCGSILQ